MIFIFPFWRCCAAPLYKQKLISKLQSQSLPSSTEGDDTFKLCRFVLWCCCEMVISHLRIIMLTRWYDLRDTSPIKIQPRTPSQFQLVPPKEKKPRELISGHKSTNTLSEKYQRGGWPSLSGLPIVLPKGFVRPLSLPECKKFPLFPSPGLVPTTLVLFSHSLLWSRQWYVSPSLSCLHSHLN